MTKMVLGFGTHLWLLYNVPREINLDSDIVSFGVSWVPGGASAFGKGGVYPGET